MLLLEANIPEFLRSSPYLQSLLSNGPFPEEGLEIPDGSGKQDLTVTSKADLIELLSTLRFWLVPELAEQSYALLRFALSPTSQTDFIEVTAEFCNDIPLVDELLQIVNSCNEKRLEIATHYGRRCVLQALCDDVGLKPTSQAACVAAGEGHLECLTYLHSRGLKLSAWTAEAAGRGGHFNCAKFIVDSSSSKKQQFIVYACREAAEHGHLACVKQMLAEWGEQCSKIVMDRAATQGHLEMLQYVTTLTHSESEVIDAMIACALDGHLQCLEHLHSLGYEQDSRLMALSAQEGHLECLQFLHEHNYPAFDVCFHAAMHDQLESLKYAHEQDMPWDESTCALAAQKGHLACLQYAREQGCPWWDGPAEEDLPVNSRNRECANKTKVAVELEDDLGELIAATACRAPTIDCLLYVLEQGASLSLTCATNAANSGSLATLQFLHARGFTWEYYDCAAAVDSGSFECLRFLHEIGTPWDARTLNAATEMYSDQYAPECRRAAGIECYEYAVAHGCPGAELHQLHKKLRK